MPGQNLRLVQKTAPGLYGPWLTSEFRFCSISREWIDRIWPNFVCTSTVTRSSLGVLPIIFCKILTRVTALDWHQNFISAQYLINKMTESYQNFYAYQQWQDLARDCCTSFFTKFWQSYGPWLTWEFCFRSISWEQMDRILPIFLCASTLTRSSLGLLPVIVFFSPWKKAHKRGYSQILWQF